MIVGKTSAVEVHVWKVQISCICASEWMHEMDGKIRVVSALCKCS